METFTVIIAQITVNFQPMNVPWRACYKYPRLNLLEPSKQGQSELSKKLKSRLVVNRQHGQEEEKVQGSKKETAVEKKTSGKGNLYPDRMEDTEWTRGIFSENNFRPVWEKGPEPFPGKSYTGERKKVARQKSLFDVLSAFGSKL